MNIRRQAAAALQKGDTTYTRQQKRMGWAGRREARARADGRAKERPREDTDGEKRKQQGAAPVSLNMMYSSVNVG